MFYVYINVNLGLSGVELFLNKLDDEFLSFLSGKSQSDNLTMDEGSPRGPIFCR